MAWPQSKLGRVILWSCCSGADTAEVWNTRLGFSWLGLDHTACLSFGSRFLLQSTYSLEGPKRWAEGVVVNTTNIISSGQWREVVLYFGKHVVLLLLEDILWCSLLYQTVCAHPTKNQYCIFSHFDKLSLYCTALTLWTNNFIFSKQPKFNNKAIEWFIPPGLQTSDIGLLNWNWQTVRPVCPDTRSPPLSPCGKFYFPPFHSVPADKERFSLIPHKLQLKGVLIVFCYKWLGRPKTWSFYKNFLWKLIH